MKLTSRTIAFQILTRHPDCLRDDVSLSGLIEDVAAAIELPRQDCERRSKFSYARAKLIDRIREVLTKSSLAPEERISEAMALLSPSQRGGQP